MTTNRRLVNVLGDPADTDVPTWVSADKEYEVSGAGPPFDPASLNPTRWFRATYPTGTWTDETATANATEDSADVTQGTAVNGLSPAHFAGPSGSNFFRCGDNNTAYGASAGSIVVLFKPATAPTNNASTILINGGLVSVQGAGVFQCAFSDTGFRASAYDGSYHECTVAASVSNWHVGAAKYDNTNVQARTEATVFASASTASSAPTLTTDDVLLGTSFQGVNNTFDGDILEILLFDTALSDADVDNLIGYFNDRYALSL